MVMTHLIVHIQLDTPGFEEEEEDMMGWVVTERNGYRGSMDG